MPLHRLNKLEIQGFRSFGNVRQSPELPDSIAVFWGGNSQGKTSLAEAIEFLFSGQITRRELLASAKDEFTEAIRNVHIQPSDPVSVEAHIQCTDGITRRLTRMLVNDYKRGNATGCITSLFIDGKPCQESDISAVLGVRLSLPPLRAPVLGQHTLGYLFSASPTDRAAFFRAVLDTQDLEDCRTAIASLQTSLGAPVHSELQDLEEVEAIPLLAAAGKAIRRVTAQDKLPDNLLTATATLLGHIGIPPAQDSAGQITQIETELETRRSNTFPLSLLRRGSFSPVVDSSESISDRATTFLLERAKVEAETQRLLALFKASLAIPAHAEHSDSEDCPLCGAPGTFNSARVLFIKEKVQSAESYSSATTNFMTCLRTAISQLEILRQSASAAIPKFMRDGAAARRKADFRISKIEGLLGLDRGLISPWIQATRTLFRAQRKFLQLIELTRLAMDDAIKDSESWNAPEDLTARLLALKAAQVTLIRQLSEYELAAKTLGERLKATVDLSADIRGWESLLRIAGSPNALWAAMQSTADYAAKVKALEKAVRDIENGNGKVLDEKFSDLSDEILLWWDRLRPDETTFFSAVQRRGDKTKRTIDLKAGLSAHEDRSNPKFRDAVAVFSQSQLHCLGLSIFLARAVQEQTGFVVMDDPVLTSDDDYRPNFTNSVIQGLLDGGVQVIICTQDHKSWKDIGTRWNHCGAAQYQIIKNDAVSGTEIRGGKDDLAAMISRAQPLVKSQDPALRKNGAQRLRDAIERFSKCLLVQDRVAKGDSAASITDYDGKNFGTYSQQVANLLAKDPSHPGKLHTAYSNLTPGPHDDKPPSQGELASALGDLKKLKKDYLD
jgi:RecF/RecN/SMC N terminal domain